MDQIKIGKFIAEMRKEQGMTQKQLADRMEISDKTISKWECGNGLPEMSLMMPLCEALQINVNELLSGERLAPDDYSRKAEENMMNLMQETDDYKKKEQRKTVFTMLSGVAGIVLAIVLLTCISGPQNVAFRYFFDAPNITVLLVITLLLLTASGLMKNFIHAFAIVCGKNETIETAELKKAKAAVEFVCKILLYAGIFISLFYIIVLLHMMDDPSTIGGHISMACTSTFYGALFNLLLLPVKSRIEAKISEQ